MSEVQPPQEATSTGKPPERSMSQSLFQIYYLGCTRVDRRCSSVVIPWIIEEQKLKSKEMKFIWLSPGPEDVTYVADSGQELFQHSYTSILQCCIAIDGISLAYIYHSSQDNKYYCHVFQALSYNEAEDIMAKFKVHSKEEVSIGSTIKSSSNSSTSLSLEISSGLIFSSSLKHHLPESTNSKNAKERNRNVSEYNVDFLGKFEVEPPPLNTKLTLFQTIDKIVSKVRESQSQTIKKKKSLGSHIRDKLTSTSSLKSQSSTSLSSEDADLSSAPKVSKNVRKGLKVNVGKYGVRKGSKVNVSNDSIDSVRDCSKVSVNTDSTDSIRDCSKVSVNTDSLDDDNTNSVLSSVSCPSLHSQYSSDVSVEVLSPTAHVPSVSDNTVNFSVEDNSEGSVSEQSNSTSKGNNPVAQPLSEVSEECVADRLKEPGSSSLKGPNKTLHLNGGQSIKSLHSTSQASSNRDPSGGETTSQEKRSDSIDFDTIPELSSLQNSPEFQALSEGSPLLTPTRKVKMVFSGLSVLLVSEANGERIMKKNIRNVVICAQGKENPNHFAFTSRSQNGNVNKYYCHLFMAESKKMAVKILELFKSVSVLAISFGVPVALCGSCPLQLLHNLCRSLEGVSTQVGQYRIQECLSKINEGDFAKIMHEYKVSELVNHEFSQIIVLVALIRQYFQRQQELHTHPGTSFIASGSDSLETSSSKLRLPALTRAKNALASSIDNLRNKPDQERRARFFKGITKSISNAEKHEDKKVTQSLNVRSHSPLFSKKAALDTLMAPIPTTAAKRSTKEDTTRERTWSGFIHKSPLASTVQVDSESREQKPVPEPEGKDEISLSSVGVHSKDPNQAEHTVKCTTFKQEDGNANQSPSSPSPKIPRTPVRKLKSNRPRSNRLQFQRRQSLTPDHNSAVAALESDPKFKRTHQRSTSYGFTNQSWRQEIFESVSTPTRPDSRTKSRVNTTTEFFEEFEIIDRSTIDQLGGSWNVNQGTFSPETQSSLHSPKTRVRKMWREAIEQQIILNRMEKENSLFQKALTDAEVKRLKLCYSNLKIDSKDFIHEWSELLAQAGEIPQDVLYLKVLQGVSPSKRGDVWSMLGKKYQVRNDIDSPLLPGLSDQYTFKQLLEEETEFENNILVDIGRTFPAHPYFSANNDGQSSLRNILHAFAVTDPETGYCQGLSFVAGIILMHTKDDEAAYELLCQLMVVYNYREMYFDNLTYLQMRLYQLSRLLHDFNPVLYQHLRVNDITPFFYAAPWFLTIFASQFPIAFTARVFDMLFCDGTDFVLKVVLSLLQLNEESILKCGTMEATCNYLKTKLPEESLDTVDAVFEKASRINFGNRLETFEVEYRVMADLNHCFKSDLVIDDFPSVSEVLKRQNFALIEQLAIFHANNNRLENVVETMQAQLESQSQRILELESKVGLLSTQTSPTKSLSFTDTPGSPDTPDQDRTLLASDEQTSC